MTQLTHATKSHNTPIKKAIYTARAHTTVKKGGPFMTKLARSTTIRCLFFGVLVLAPSSWAQQRAPIREGG